MDDGNKNHPNADLVQLHLSDEMIGLLKSGKINIRVLCEMAAHRDFVKLADVEVYVYGVASMQVRNLNAWIRHGSEGRRLLLLKTLAISSEA